MYDLTNPTVIKHLCDEFGFSFKKGFGQNFLTDASILKKIADAADADGILEIGPGFGTLTAVLGTCAKKVISLEIDKTLEPVLKSTLVGFDNIKVLFSDVMKTDLKKLLEEEFQGMNVSVAANLPYYLTSPILMKLLEEKLPFRNIVVMVQKEVADRIVAKAGTKDYGALTLAISYYADAEIIAHVPKESFIPAPKVDSAVVKLTLLDSPPIEAPEKDFFKLVKASFAQRRKTMLNALSNSNNYGSKEEIRAILEKAGYDSNLRGETLSMQEFSQLALRFCESKKNG